MKNNLFSGLFGFVVLAVMMVVLVQFAYNKSVKDAKYKFTDTSTGQVISVNPDNSTMDADLSGAKFVSYDYITGTLALEKSNGKILVYVVNNYNIFGPVLKVDGIVDDKSVLQGIDVDTTKRFLNYLVKHDVFYKVEFVSYSEDTDTVTYRDLAHTYTAKLN